MSSRFWGLALIPKITVVRKRSSIMQFIFEIALYGNDFDLWLLLFRWGLKFPISRTTSVIFFLGVLAFYLKHLSNFSACFWFIVFQWHLYGPFSDVFDYRWPKNVFWNDSLALTLSLFDFIFWEHISKFHYSQLHIRMI